MTQNILNPAAVKLSVRIEHLGVLVARWFESAETKRLNFKNFKVSFRSFFTWLELHERVIGWPRWTGWLILPVTDENRTELCKHKILRKCWKLQAIAIGGLSQIYVWQNYIINLDIYVLRLTSENISFYHAIKIMTQHRNKRTSFFCLSSKEPFTHQSKPPVVHQLSHQLSWTKGICSKIDPMMR